MAGNAFQLLHPLLRKMIAERGYREPTPVQEKAIPVVLRGSHALIIAPTGSGKTEAALFPIFSRFLEEGGSVGGLWALYITPLRSLNRDIVERMAELAESLGIDFRVRHGDSTESDKREFLRSPPDIAVTTPESLYFLLSAGGVKFRRMLSSLRYIVVDELHELVESKRGAELALALERVEEYSKRRVQRIGLSATLSKPEIAASVLVGSRPIEVIDMSYMEKRSRIVVVSPAPSAEAESIARKLGLENPYTAARLLEVKRLAESTEKGVIVFTNTRDTSEVVGAMLKKLLGDENVLVHHGSLSREERLRAEKLFKKGRVKVVVATSSLELGVDIGHADLVVQYSSPRQAVRLVQRVGRSRHKLGLESRGVIIASENFYDVLESIVIAARALRGDLEPLEPYSKPYDALAHQLAGIVLEKNRVGLEDVFWLARRTHYYRDLSLEELSSIASYMDYAKIVRLVDSREVKKGRRLYSYYYNTTMIPDTKQYPVYDTVTGEKIGVLDEEFAATLGEGDLFVLGGRVWEVVGIEEEAVRVQPARETHLLPPAWEGDLIPVDWRVAREAGSLIRRVEEKGFSALEEYPADETAKRLVVETIEKHAREGYPLPTDKRVVVESMGRLTIVYAFLGTKAAKALELALSWLAGNTYGYPPRSSSTPYAVLLEHYRPIPAEKTAELLEKLASLEEEDVEEIVVDALKKTRLYEWKLYHVALRMGAIDKDKTTSLDSKQYKRLVRYLSETVVGVEALRETLHDKIDFKPLHKLLKSIREKKTIVAYYNTEKPSPLAEHVLTETRMGDKISVDTLPPQLLAEIVKRRIQAKKTRLVCLRCGYTWEAVVGELPEKPRCPQCGVGFVAPTRLAPQEARALVLKARRRERMPAEDKRRIEELREAADLVLSYGRRAIEALAGHGIGPATARKVLRKLALSGEEAFYRAILEAEQQFIRTRKYWRD